MEGVSKTNLQYTVNSIFQVSKYEDKKDILLTDGCIYYYNRVIKRNEAIKLFKDIVKWLEN